ncbi:hypothetical protein [Changpingibacter yushuensis]|uniref:hypothetical protein n=1 Tax=Changpingibacter yushuensis TaxID=2758440 RepID=UPI00165D7B60|nr:hypothetical protein [Changpingibacter yushuensis]
MTDSPLNPELTSAQQLLGDFAPELASLTDDVLFGRVWARLKRPHATAANNETKEND